MVLGLYSPMGTMQDNKFCCWFLGICPNFACRAYEIMLYYTFINILYICVCMFKTLKLLTRVMLDPFDENKMVQSYLKVIEKGGTLPRNFFYAPVNSPNNRIGGVKFSLNIVKGKVYVKVFTLGDDVTHITLMLDTSNKSTKLIIKDIECNSTQNLEVIYAYRGELDLVLGQGFTWMLMSSLKNREGILEGMLDGRVNIPNINSSRVSEHNKYQVRVLGWMKKKYQLLVQREQMALIEGSCNLKKFYEEGYNDLDCLDEHDPDHSVRGRRSLGKEAGGDGHRIRGYSSAGGGGRVTLSDSRHMATSSVKKLSGDIKLLRKSADNDSPRSFERYLGACQVDIESTRLDLEDGGTLLNYAIMKKSYKIAKLLLEKGADIEVQDTQANTMLCALILQLPKETRVKKSNYKKIMDLLISKDSEAVKRMLGGMKEVNLMHLIHIFKDDLFSDCVESKNSSFKIKDNFREIAVRCIDLYKVKLQGTDKDAAGTRDEGGRANSAQFLESLDSGVAIESSSTEVTERGSLSDSKVIVEKITHHTRILDDDRSFSEEIVSRLQGFIKNKDVVAFIDFLEKEVGGIDSHCLDQEDGGTILNYALMHKNYDIAKYLLERGANIGAVDNKGNTMLCALIYGNLLGEVLNIKDFKKVLSLLIDYGVESSLEHIILDRLKVLMELYQGTTSVGDDDLKNEIKRLFRLEGYNRREKGQNSQSFMPTKTIHFNYYSKCTIISVLGDGHCFFSAYAQIINKNNSTNYEQQDVREKLADFLCSKAKDLIIKTEGLKSFLISLDYSATDKFLNKLNLMEREGKASDTILTEVEDYIKGIIQFGIYENEDMKYGNSTLMKYLDEIYGLKTGFLSTEGSVDLSFDNENVDGFLVFNGHNHFDTIINEGDNISTATSSFNIKKDESQSARQRESRTVDLAIPSLELVEVSCSPLVSKNNIKE